MDLAIFVYVDDFAKSAQSQYLYRVGTNCVRPQIALQQSVDGAVCHCCVPEAHV